MANAPSAFLGVDVGTSAVKAVVMSEGGDVLAAMSVPLTIQTPRPSWAEQDPDAWWTAAREAMRNVVERAGGARAIAAIGVSGQMHSSVFLDAHGDVVRPALLWCDARTTAECQSLTQQVGETQLGEWTANAAFEGFTLPKVLWLRANEPAQFARVAKILLPKDYIRYRLTGVLATEPSDASGTLMYDVRRGEWSAPLLAAVDLPLALLPSLGESAEVLGHVSSAVAAEIGLRAGTPVVGGGADNACGAIGVGVVTPGEAVASWGTSGTVLAPAATPVVDRGLRAHTFRHAAPDLWYVMGVVLSAGGAFAWFRNELARDLAGTRDADRLLDTEAASVAVGSDGLTFLPYLQGERTPHRDASARGAFAGLTLAHTRAHLTRAVAEGIAFAMRDCLSLLGELELPFETLVLSGGGSRSRFLRTLQANVYGTPVAVPVREEGPAYGAALLAAVGVGAFPDVASACRATVRRGPTEAFDADVHAAYEEPYQRFGALYAALVESRARLSS